MSTILEALRKARTESLPNSVDASPGILNPYVHDYLAAAAPRPAQDEVLVLRRVLYGAAAIIVVLLLAVVSLFLRQNSAEVVRLAAAQRSSGQKLAEPPASAEEGVAAVSALETPPLPLPAVPEQPVRIAVMTPAPIPTVSPFAEPEPVLIPIAVGGQGTLGDLESDSEVRARAAQLRDQLATQPDPPRPRRASNVSGSGGGSKSSSIQDIRIGGILWDKDSPMATVEGKVVKPGSAVNGARILRINKDSIVFDCQGREVTVRQ